MKSFFVTLGLSIFMIPPLLSQEAGTKRTYDVAVEVFRSAVARSFKLKEADLFVNPVLEVDQAAPPYKGLKTGEMWPFYITKKGDITTVVRGFGSATGQVAFLGYERSIGQGGGLTVLLESCAVLERRKRMDAESVAKRLAWCLEPSKVGTDEHLFDAKVVKEMGWTPPKGVRKAEYRPQKTGVMLVYFTTSQGNTGTLDFHKISVTVLPNYELVVQREDVR